MNPMTEGNMRNGRVIERTDRLGEAVNDSFQRVEKVVAESSTSKFFPNLFHRIHLRGMRGNLKQYDIVRYVQVMGSMPRRAVAQKENDVVGVLLSQPFEKQTHALGIVTGKNQEERVAGQRVRRAVNIDIFPDALTGDARTDAGRTPTVFGDVDPTERRLVLNHQPDALTRMFLP